MQEVGFEPTNPLGKGWPMADLESFSFGQAAILLHASVSMTRIFWLCSNRENMECSPSHLQAGQKLSPGSRRRRQPERRILHCWQERDPAGLLARLQAGIHSITVC